MKCGRICLLILFAIVAVAARAESYMATFDQAQWQVQRSPLLCRLTQAVPHFGEAIFETIGGGHQRFLLHAEKNPLASGSAEITAVAPSWNPSRKPVALGVADFVDGNEPLQLGAEPMAHLLDSLHDGLVPVFTRTAQNDANEIASVALSPVNFLPAYRQYNACVEQLLPVTFEQMQHTVIEFAQTQSDLSAEAQKKIDLLLRYIAVDHSITRFEINAISNDNKRMLDNLELAKQRTQQVSEYLMSRGINASAIETSYHAARAVSNNQQRFVSIRLRRNGATN